MSEGAQGIAILVGSATLLSLPLHLRIRSFLLASLASGAAASLVLQIADTMHRGYPDMFAPIALFFGAFWGPSSAPQWEALSVSHGANGRLATRPHPLTGPERLRR